MYDYSKINELLVSIFNPNKFCPYTFASIKLKSGVTFLVVKTILSLYSNTTYTSYTVLSIIGNAKEPLILPS